MDVKPEFGKVVIFGVGLIVAGMSSAMTGATTDVPIITTMVAVAVVPTITGTRAVACRRNTAASTMW